MAQLIFTPDNWNQPQTLTINTVNDANTVDNTYDLTLSINADQTTAAEYRDLGNSTIKLTVIDGDQPGFIVTPTLLSIPEDNQTGTFTVTLSAQPSSDVVFTISSSSNDDATVTPTTLTFTPDNWNQPQQVMITSVDDTIDRDDSATITVVVNAGESANEFDELEPQTVAVTLIDNDGAPVTDGDGDGIPDSEENQAPGGDGNGDGIPDSEQADVTTRQNDVAGGTITVQVSGGCGFAPAYEVESEGEQTAQDNAFRYPLGLLDVSLNCQAPGATATLKVFYDRQFDTTNWEFRKFMTNTNSYTDLTTFQGFGTQQLADRTVTTARYTLTDGSVYDMDGKVDGQITDPAGAAIVSRGGPVGEVVDNIIGPGGILSQTGANIFTIIGGSIGLLVSGAYLLVRRRARTNSIN